MSRLRVEALGGLSVAAPRGRRLPIAGSCRLILGYLLTNRQRRVPRLELAETLWADHKVEQARRCLSTALWRLKRSTGAAADLLAFHGADDVSFNLATLWVDSVALELRVAPLVRRKPETLTRDDLARLERGVRLYRGDYLAGMEQEWAWLERQRLRNLYCDGLYKLVAAHALASQWRQVLHWGRCLSGQEPLREDVHRLLMLAHANTGNRASAIAQYRHCERALSEDLGVAPMAETRQLYRELVSKTVSRSATPQPSTAPALDHLRRRINRVRRVLVASQRQLDQALDALAAQALESSRSV